MKRRTLQAEWMDEPGLESGLHDEALVGIARINRFSAAAAALWSPLKRLAARHGPLRVLDLACGSGDVVLNLTLRAQRDGVPLTIAGCDVSARAVEVSRERGSAEFFRCDVLGDEFPASYDVYLASLFLHHLPDDRAMELLRRMATGRAFLVSDLRRTRWGYLLARWGTPFITSSPVVRNDAPVSVHNAYSIEEVRGLLLGAGVEGARIRRQWPQRYLIEWER